MINKYTCFIKNLSEVSYTTIKVPIQFILFTKDSASSRLFPYLVPVIPSKSRFLSVSPCFYSPHYSFTSNFDTDLVSDFTHSNNVVLLDIHSWLDPCQNLILNDFSLYHKQKSVDPKIVSNSRSPPVLVKP